MHLRKDDIVEIICGADRGRAQDRTRGKVLRVLRDRGKVIVEGINRVYRHVRRSQRNLQGGRLSKEMPVAVSNVMLVCSACGKATRTGARLRTDGLKERYCKKCSAGIGLISAKKERKKQKASA
jgi:large subunit ribosomal protein L24